MAIGTSESTIEKVKTNHECPQCNQTGCLSFEVKASYFHIAFIPFTNVSKSILAVCSKCNATTPLYKMPVPLKKAAEKEKTFHQIPVWNFLGLILAIAIGPSIINMVTYPNYNMDLMEESYNTDIYSEYETDEKVDDFPELTESRYIANPVIGDVYIYMIREDSYSSMLLGDITSDSMYVRRNHLAVPKPEDVYLIDSEEYYKKETTAYSIDRIETMYWTDSIYKIIR